MPIHRHHHPNQEDATTIRSPINLPNLSPKPNSRKLLYFLLRSIIMALVLSLFLFFLGIAALVLLHFFLSSSASSFHRHRYRHHNRRSSSFAPAATATQSSSYTIQELHKFLPSFGYSFSEVEITEDCAICLECFKEGVMCRKLPACDHVFHMRCVDEWLAKVPNCPTCRSRVQLYCGASSSAITDDDSKLLWAANVS